jgi:hypothetical protein
VGVCVDLRVAFFVSLLVLFVGGVSRRWKENKSMRSGPC